ncbi:hypothetical protein M409DRAFT_25640 [Zasmidium cellare ATCC 36951]|uniref:Uncharacterized protein n=1 Tax=Zasmidium cellare ATCC 36951 TaxID=1080233 RepID=A0A6A6CA12_ZASCE|nr:uncharacterized protein M409DRAFT_25640 [Zasmidium cellare ATCC 36951]KAF2163865.1 hypothetical protein M409DRAFT_25640 [Zasmidium cellare ATCC 36951]
MPCRIGQDDAVDSAIRAVVKNKDIALKGYTGPTPASLGPYVKSVESLRIAMVTREDSLSDSVLMSVALLCVCEALMQSEMFACFAHWAAMSTILLSRPLSWQPSELTRAILYHIRNQTFHIPVARGQISPFDDPRWYTLEPAGASSLPTEVARLKLLSNQLMIRLPRLILQTRTLRNGADEIKGKKALALATELSNLQDIDAENKMLHRIKVIKTTNSDDADFIPFFFEFTNLSDLETAVVYWKSQLILGRLRLKLKDLFPHYDFDVDELNTSMERMAINTMMSHQHARNRQQYAHARGMVAMPTGWTAVWGLWKDRKTSFRGITVDEWKRFNRDRINESIAIWKFQAGDKQIDEASDLLAGGPLEGTFVAAFAHIPFWAMNVPSKVR